MPDVSFFAATRLPVEGEPESAWPMAPDLAVEIIAPSATWEAVNHKLRAYCAAGVREVWLVSLGQRTVLIHHALANIIELTADDDLTSELLPGFRCHVSELFKQPAHQPAQG